MPNRRKIGVFIDGANFWNCQKENGWRIDFYKLKGFFYKRGFVEDLYYFTPTMPYLERFLNTLDSLGYIIVKKPIKKFKTRDKNGVHRMKHKGDLDMEMGLTIFKNLKKYDEIILVTGDSDFECIVDELKSARKNIVCLCNDTALAHEIRRKVNRVFLLNKLKKQLKYKKQPPL